jgi:hypothetical protein
LSEYRAIQENRRNEVMWIVGKQNTDSLSEWEFQGLFDSEEQAVAACVARRDGVIDMFVGPAELNVAVKRKKGSWPGAYYPSMQHVEACRTLLRERVARTATKGRK